MQCHTSSTSGALFIFCVILCVLKFGRIISVLLTVLLRGLLMRQLRRNSVNTRKLNKKSSEGVNTGF